MADGFRPRLSARLRILGWILALTALAVVGALLLSQRLLLQQLDAEVNGHLEQEVDEVSQLVGGRDPATGLLFGSNVVAMFDTYLRRNVAADGEAFYTFVGGSFYRATYEPVRLGEAPRAGDRWAALTEPASGELSTDAGPVRWLALPIQDAAGETLGVFVVANFLSEERQQIAHAINTGLLVAGAVLVSAAFVGWMVAGRILRPIREVTDTARAISESDLSARIEVDGDDEVAELARTFNAMVDRLETAFDTQQAFLDDAGHELRTPITIVRGHLELLGDDPDERRETIALVTDELDRMSRIVDDLLLLAKLERPDFLRPVAVEIEPFTAELFAKAQALDRRSWRLGGSARTTVVADPQRLTQAVMNLARNAVEHSAPDATVTVGSAAGNGEVRFWVADTGPGVPADEQAAVFERFVRGGDRRRRSDGAGLGLAIVRGIADAHGGRVELDSAPGRGARFTVVVPTAPPPPTVTARTATTGPMSDFATTRQATPTTDAATTTATGSTGSTGSTASADSATTAAGSTFNGQRHEVDEASPAGTADE
ncbi:MAG: ATP-binding protein [Acidimicrobiales bacterium]